MFCFKFFFLVSYQSPCSNLYTIGRNRLHDDPRSICSAPGDLLRDFVHVFPSFTDDFLLFPSDDGGWFAPTVTTVAV